MILFKASDTEKHGKLQKKDKETKYSSCLNIIQPSVHFQLFSYIQESYEYLHFCTKKVTNSYFLYKKVMDHSFFV